MSAIQQTLQDIGFSRKEAAVYLAALNLGTSSAPHIARTAKVQRTHIYGVLNDLTKRGLISQSVSGKRTRYTAAPPDQIVSTQKERLAKLESAVPELRALMSLGSNRPKITYYEGSDGIDRLNEETLKNTKEIVGFTTPYFITKHTKATGQSFIKKRTALRIPSRVIGEASPEVEALQKKDLHELRETRILSKTAFSTTCEIVICDTKVCIIDYRNEFGFIIEGKEIASTLKMIFELVWGRWEV